MKDLVDSLVSDFENEGIEEREGPPRSSEVVEALFLGVEVPLELLEGWLPMLRYAARQGMIQISTLGFVDEKRRIYTTNLRSVEELGVGMGL